MQLVVIESDHKNEVGLLVIEGDKQWPLYMKKSHARQKFATVLEWIAKGKEDLLDIETGSSNLIRIEVGVSKSVIKLPQLSMTKALSRTESNAGPFPITLELEQTRTQQPDMEISNENLKIIASDMLDVAKV